MERFGAINEISLKYGGTIFNEKEMFITFNEILEEGEWDREIDNTDKEILKELFYNEIKDLYNVVELDDWDIEEVLEKY